MLTTDFATYSGRRTRPFALPLTLAGQGCPHSTGKACVRCLTVAQRYAAVMAWAGLISFDFEEEGEETSMNTETYA